MPVTSVMHAVIRNAGPGLTTRPTWFCSQLAAAIVASVPGGLTAAGGSRTVHEGAHRGERRSFEHGTPAVGGVGRLEGGGCGLAEPTGQVGREHDARLRGLGGEAQGTDHATDAQRSIDVVEPQAQLLLLLQDRFPREEAAQRLHQLGAGGERARPIEHAPWGRWWCGTAW